MAYVRDYNPQWQGCCEHKITAASNAESAKKQAIEMHKMRCEQTKKESDATLTMADQTIAALRNDIQEYRIALARAHGCATLRDDGTCDGCFISEVLSK